MEAMSLIDTTICEVRQVAIPAKYLPNMQCYITTDSGDCLELQLHSPWAEKLALKQCKLSDWYTKSCENPSSIFCTGRTLKDIVKSEYYASIGLLLEEKEKRSPSERVRGEDGRVVLFLDGCPIAGTIATVIPVTSDEFNEGDLVSWLSGNPISLR